MNTMTALLALKALDAALMVGEFAAADRESLESSVKEIRQMIRENRDPTDAEWAAVNKVSDDILTRLAQRAGG